MQLFGTDIVLLTLGAYARGLRYLVCHSFINPRRMREGYGTWFVIRSLTLGACARVTVLNIIGLSFVHSLTLGACARVTVLGLQFAVHRAAENSDHFYALVKL